MNKIRRRKLADIAEQITVLQEMLEALQEEEQEAYDNLPESLQYTERGETMGAAIDSIQTAIDNLGDAIDSIEEVTT